MYGKLRIYYFPLRNILARTIGTCKLWSKRCVIAHLPPTTSLHRIAAFKKCLGLWKRCLLSPLTHCTVIPNIAEKEILFVEGTERNACVTVILSLI